MPSDKSKSNTPKDQQAREKHDKRPEGQGTHVKGDPEKGRAKLDKLMKDWKDDIDETPFPDKG